MAIEVFNRVEKKYMIDDYQYNLLNRRLLGYMCEDRYCRGNNFYSISNIYYDTWDDELIRRSIEKPVYKEKLRLRSYGVPGLSDMVFLEIKKKYNGLVNKRRTKLRLDEAYEFLDKRIIPQDNKYINRQVVNELNYFIDYYSTLPKVYIAYDRKALFGMDDNELRITFDTNIRTRRSDLRLEAGDKGEQLLERGKWLMEIKTIGSIPMWLCEVLSDLQIFPYSFSKYGTEYKRYFMRKMTEKNGEQI